MTLGIALLPLLLSGSARSDPFDVYLHSVKAHQQNTDFVEFARVCKFESLGKQPIRGVNPGALWIPTNDIAKEVYNLESDFFSSAEVWLQDGKPRVVVLWSLELDVGSEIRTMACLNEHGKPVRMQVTNWSIPVDGKAGGWTHQQFNTFDDAGKLVSKQGHFVDTRGKRAPKPKLDEDQEGSFDWAPDQLVILKIESDLVESRTETAGKK
jgi:hypothetical protein